MPSAADYRQLLVDARKEQLMMTRDNLTRLAKAYDRAAQNIADHIRNLPGYMLSEGHLDQAYYTVLLHQLDGMLADLKVDYADLLDVSMLDSAQTAAQREEKIQNLMASSAPKDPRLMADMIRTRTLSDGERVTVQFGRVAQGAVQAVANRVYRDGLNLSARLYNLDQGARNQIGDTIVQAIAEQVSAKELASRLESTLTAPNVANSRYNAMRIARTEINNAHREAHIQSTINPYSGALKSYIQAIGFRLSLSHSETDVCDLWAGYDSGLGPGNYLPGDVPVEHPHGLCYTVTVLTDYPDVSGPGKQPDLANVPEVQLTYYANHGDPVAEAHLASLQREPAPV